MANAGCQDEIPAKVVLFSSHDVTVLPFLFALGEWHCQAPSVNGEDRMQNSYSRWPGYGRYNR